jgi:AraC-like DNA-binding protein
MNTLADSGSADALTQQSHDFVSLDRNAVLGGVDLCRARFITRVSQAHAHSDFEIGIVGTGQRQVRCRGRTYQAIGGSIVVFSPGEIHSGAPLDEFGSTYQSFLVSRETLANAFGAGIEPWFDSPVIQDQALAARLSSVHAALELGGWDNGREQELHDSLTSFTRQYGIAGNQPETRPEHAGVRQIRIHLETCYGSRIKLEPLAASVGLSVFQLIRLFRQATGLPPYAYLEQIRIDRAVTMLREGVPVSEVAFRTGFSDQSHLTRFFKRLTGVPPGRYRRSVEKVGFGTPDRSLTS